MAWELDGNNNINDNRNFLGTRNNAALVIKTNTNNAPPNLEEVMRITPSSQTTMGNVGIGTTTPTQRLTLGSGNILLPNAIAGTDGNLYFGGITDQQQTGMRLFGGNLSPQIQAGFIDVRTPDLNDGLRIRVDNGNGGTERLRVTAGGNVGIGTSQPAARCAIVAQQAPDLAGSALSSTLVTSTGRLGTNAGDELPLASIGFHAQNNISLGVRAQRTSNGDGWPSTSLGIGMDVDNTPRAGANIWLSANGNVGIGTPAPSARLTITGGGAAVNGVTVGTDVPGVVNYPFEYETVGVVGAAMNLRLQSPNGLFFHTGNPPTEKVQITAAGSLMLNGEIFLGSIRTSIRGFDGGGRSGYHWIRTDGDEGDLWMAFAYAFPGTNIPKRMEGAVPFYGTFINASDGRTKTNVRQVSETLGKLEKIRGVVFDWKESRQTLGGIPGQRSMGVIAQEVEAVFPELVSCYGDQAYKAVNYSGLTGVLIEAIKELKVRNDALSDRIEALERA